MGYHKWFYRERTEIILTFISKIFPLTGLYGILTMLLRYLEISAGVHNILILMSSFFFVKSGQRQT